MLQRASYYSFDSHLIKCKKVNSTNRRTDLIKSNSNWKRIERSILSDEAQMRLEEKKKQERKQYFESACFSFPTFLETLSKHQLLPFQRMETTTVQVNVGLLCVNFKLFKKKRLEFLHCFEIIESNLPSLSCRSWTNSKEGKHEKTRIRSNSKTDFEI